MVFLTVGQAGMRAGYSTPYEWYILWLANAAEGMPYDSPTYAVMREVQSAFAMFFRGCASEENFDEMAITEDKKVIEMFRTMY